MIRGIFEELYEDIVWEFAARFGKDALSIFWEADLMIEDTEDKAIEKFLYEIEQPINEGNILFLKNFTKACDSLQETSGYLAGAMGKTLEEYILKDQILNEKWKFVSRVISNGV